MAGRKTGRFWNRVLDFVGIVDDENPRESRDLLEESYERQSYGRGSTYNPQSTRAMPTRRRTDARVPQARSSAYSSRPRYNSGYASEDDLDMGAGYRSEERRDYSTRPNPAMNRTSSSARLGRASRFAEDDDADLREPSASVPAVRERRAPSQQRMVMLSMQRLEDCCDVIDHLIAGNMVLLTLDDMDIKLHQRVVDTLSGSVYALKARIRKASERTYLVAPGSVDIDDAEYVARSF